MKRGFRLRVTVDVLLTLISIAAVAGAITLFVVSAFFVGWLMLGLAWLLWAWTSQDVERVFKAWEEQRSGRRW